MSIINIAAIAGIVLTIGSIIAIIVILASKSLNRMYNAQQARMYKVRRVLATLIIGLVGAVILIAALCVAIASRRADASAEGNTTESISGSEFESETEDVSEDIPETDVGEPESETETATESDTETETEATTESITESTSDVAASDAYSYAEAARNVASESIGNLSDRLVSDAAEEESEVATTTTEVDTDAGADTDEDLSATELWARDAQQAASQYLAAYAAKFAPDDTVCEVSEIIRIDPDEASREFGQYRLDTKLHTDWKEPDWLQEHMATLNYGETAIDLLMYPAWADFLWLEQAAGTREITAEDLQGIDIADHDAVLELLDSKVPQWKSEWDALSDAEKADRVDELVYTSICNCPGYAEAWYLAFCEAEGVYDSCKDVLDDVGRRFDWAYDLTATVTFTDSKGNVREIGPDDEDYPKGRERWLVYPDNVNFFNADRPEFSATYSDDYFENIAAQLCNIYRGLRTGKIQKLSTDKHWCLPRLTISAMRRAAAANYEDYYESLLKLVPGKNGNLAYKYGVNLSDLRPELFPITVRERQTPPPPSKPVNDRLWIEYKYDAVDGPEVGPEYKATLTAGAKFSVKTPTAKEGYVPHIAVQEGYPGTFDDIMLLKGVMPSNNVHVVIVFTKPVTRTPNTILVDYKYDSIYGAKVAEPYCQKHYAGEQLTINSPVAPDYSIELALCEGYQKELLTNLMSLNIAMPNNDVHIILVYKKNGTDNNNHESETPTPPSTTPDPDPNPQQPEVPKDGEGAKVPAASSDNAQQNDQGTGGEHYEDNGESSGDGDANFEEPKATNSYTPPASSSSSSSSTSTSTSISTSTTQNQEVEISTTEDRVETSGTTSTTIDNGDGTQTTVTESHTPANDEVNGTLELDD